MHLRHPVPRSFFLPLSLSFSLSEVRIEDVACEHKTLSSRHLNSTHYKTSWLRSRYETSQYKGFVVWEKCCSEMSCFDKTSHYKGFVLSKQDISLQHITNVSIQGICLIMCCSDMYPLYWGDLFKQIPSIQGIHVTTTHNQTNPLNTRESQYKGCVWLCVVVTYLVLTRRLNSSDYKACQRRCHVFTRHITTRHLN